MTDDVLKEIRAVREAYVEAHHFDVRSIVADLQQLDAHGDLPVVVRSPRPAARFKPLEDVAPRVPKFSGLADDFPSQTSEAK